MSVQVDPVRTPITPADLYGVIQTQWPEIVGGEMPPAAGAMLVTQSDLECGPAWHNCWNGNVGNLAGTGGAAYVMLHASDGTFRPYRAYDTLFDGIADWLRLMKREPGALAAAAGGDVDGFVAGLVAGKYFQEPPQKYLTGMEARYQAYASSLGGGAPAKPKSPGAPALASSSFFPALLLAAGIGAAAYAAVEVSRALQTSARGRRAYG